MQRDKKMEILDILEKNGFVVQKNQSRAEMFWGGKNHVFAEFDAKNHLHFVYESKEHGRKKIFSVDTNKNSAKASAYGFLKARNELIDMLSKGQVIDNQAKNKLSKTANNAASLLQNMEKDKADNYEDILKNNSLLWEETFKNISSALSVNVIMNEDGEISFDNQTIAEYSRLLDARSSNKHESIRNLVDKSHARLNQTRQHSQNAGLAEQHSNKHKTKGSIEL